ncbi:SET domain-containing protein 4 [Monosporozyma servazzii]
MTGSTDPMGLKLLKVRNQIQSQLNSSMMETSLFNPLISPGPASITLLQSNDNERRHTDSTEYTHTDSKPKGKDVSITPSNSISRTNSSTSTSSIISQSNLTHPSSIAVKQGRVGNNNNSNENSRKGLVAAAALSLAVTKPFPPKQNQSSNQTDSSHNNNNFNKIPNSYILPKQTNILTCQCGTNDTISDLTHSKKLLIQCHHCNRWQHMKCYGLKNKLEILPIKFYCNVCQPELTMKTYKISKKMIDKKKNLKPQNRLLHESNVSSQAELDVATQLTKIRNNLSSQQEKNESYPVNNTSHKTVERFDSRSSSIASLLSNESIGNKQVPTQRIKSIYADKYVEGFITNHNNDDWVVQMNKLLTLPREQDIIYCQSIGNSAFKGVFANKPIHQGEYISEVSGEIDFQKNYTMNPDNQYRILGTTQPGVFFHPHWPIYVDSRNVCSSDNGSPMMIKQLRRSCEPNVELKTVRVPLTSKDELDIRYIICATKDIKQGEELLIKWQWDLRHPICQTINDNQTLSRLNDMDKFWLIHSIDTIWQTSPCACQSSGQKDSCALLKVKLYAERFHEDLKMHKNKQTIDKIHK